MVHVKKFVAAGIALCAVAILVQADDVHEAARAGDVKKIRELLESKPEQVHAEVVSRCQPPVVLMDATLYDAQCIFNLRWEATQSRR